MIRGVVCCMPLAVALALGGVARADDVVAYEAEGDAAASATDARTAALDDAFARAVTSALADLVDGDARTAHQDELDKEIVGHARLWVARFTVTKDEVDDERRELTVSVRIDRDKLRARLGELKIAVKSAGDATVGDEGDVPGARTATVLLRITSGHGVRASFGKGADHDLDGLAQLTSRLRDAGYAVHRAPDDAPAGADDVAALAAAATADFAVVAGVTVGNPAFVRGQSGQAVLATAHVDLVDAKHAQKLGQGTASAAASPDDARSAIAHALDSAAADALPSTSRQLGPAAVLSAADDRPVAEPGVVLLRLSPKTPYSLVLAEQRYLAGARGVHAAALRRLSPAGWVIGVTTADPIEHVAQLAKKPPASDTSSAVKIVGDVVEVALTGSAATP